MSTAALRILISRAGHELSRGYAHIFSKAQNASRATSTGQSTASSTDKSPSEPPQRVTKAAESLFTAAMFPIIIHESDRDTGQLGSCSVAITL